MLRTSALAFVLLGLPAGVLADASFPLIVVVESASAAVDAPTVRGAIARDVPGPVVALDSPEARRAGGALTVAIAPDGRQASLHFRALEGTSHWSSASAPSNARGYRWLVEAAVALMRHARLELTTGFALASEVLDPFVEQPAPAPAQAGPWVAGAAGPASAGQDWPAFDERVVERARGLSAPRFGRRR